MIRDKILVRTNENILDYIQHSDFDDKLQLKQFIKELVDKTIYTINSPIIEGIVERIDENWKNNNKETMKYYINYIQVYLEFMEGIKDEH